MDKQECCAALADLAKQAMGLVVAAIDYQAACCGNGGTPPPPEEKKTPQPGVAPQPIAVKK